MERTHYEILEVSPTASPEAIRGTYKFLTQKWHPDRNPDQRELAEQITKALSAAYFVLSDPIRRRQYDKTLGDQFRSSRVIRENAASQGFSSRTEVPLTGAQNSVPEWDRWSPNSAYRDVAPSMVERRRRRGKAPRWIEGVSGGLLGIVLLLSGASGAFKWIQNLNQNARAQTVTSQAAENNKAQQFYSGRERCVSAVQSRVAPEQVLDVTYDEHYGLTSRLPIPSFPEDGLEPTTTGYRSPINADIGGRTVSFECYLDKNYQVISLSYMGG